MAYDYDEFNTSRSYEYDDNSLGFDNSDLLSVRDDWNESGDQQTGTRESGEVEENQESDTDYFDILGDIYSTCDLSSEQIESLVVQVDNLNENVVTLNENIKIGVGFLFAVTVILSIRVIFNIMNKILGLGSA